MTVREVLAEGARRLGDPSPSALIDSPALDASLLLAEVLAARREDLIVRGEEPVAEQDREKFAGFLSRRKNGECVAYILGRREFRGLEFAVNSNVLVPRPDTETLVEAALEYIDSAPEEEKKTLSLLDLCAGSGALAVSLKNERPFLSVTASDISGEALETAAANAARLLPANAAVHFIQSDLFGKIAGKFSVIVSNPPYVPAGEILALAPEVRREPRLALDGGGDGLDVIRKIISRAPERLLPKGLLLLEADPGQMPAIRMLLKRSNFSRINIHKDLAGRDRVVSALSHQA
jgi:release factor glutamine methyltransferase